MSAPGSVLITGASRGIGAALLALLRGRGVDVLGTATRAEGDLLALDVSDPASIAALAERLVGRPVEALVCNAGVYEDRGLTLGAYDADVMARAFAVNATGPLLTVQALLPNLEASRDAGGAPRVAIVSSQMGSSERPVGGSYAYCASKAAAINVARNLAVESAKRGIAVGVYHPGWVRTDMGGSGAAISAEESAEGLAARLDALSVERTGAFETWDGRPHPY